ncbi:MAG: VIT domain-containing protein [bacterium]
MTSKKGIMPVIAAFCMGLFLVTSAGADGLIVVTPPHTQVLTSPFPLEVTYHRVDAEIDEQAATTHIDQEFFNPSERRLEGHYLFPVPQGAVIERFSMYIDGKEVEAELLDADKARRIYEDIVRRQRDPALLEYDGLALFKVRIFPIEPRSTKRVSITYHEVLGRDDGTIAYRYPLNTEKFSSAPLKEVRLKVSIDTKDTIRNVYCTSHDAEIIRKNDHHVTVAYEAEQVKPDRDFLLYYSTDRSKIGISLLTYREEGKEGYFLLNASPGFTEDEEISDKDITFVLDVSGSMAGEKLAQAKKALLFCIENLNKGDRFEVIRFATEAQTLFGDLSRTDEENRAKARRFIGDLKAIGGTNIQDALTLALAHKTEEGRPRIIVFITDGKPTINETNEERLLDIIKKANPSRTRIFTFGIGYDLNIHLLDTITEMTKAYRTYISPEEDIEVKVSGFYQKVQSPVLTDIDVSTGKDIALFTTYPTELPDLFRGSSLTLVGRYKGEGGNTRLTIAGKVKNREKRFEFDVDFPGKDLRYAYIPALWAARRIGFLLDQIRLHGEDKELVEEITQLARHYGIVTPYTSYLIIEDELDRAARNELDRAYQTLGGIASGDKELAERSREGFLDMKAKSGYKGVRASEEVQVLNDAWNLAQTRQGESRLSFKDSMGNTQQLTRQVRNIQGRAFYNTGNVWVDALLQAQKKKKQVRIQFASEQYFDLLTKEPQAAQFLSLGRNVRFTMNNQVYEIYD